MNTNDKRGRLKTRHLSSRDLTTRHQIIVEQCW